MNAEIRNTAKNISCTVSLTGSKSITNRVLIIQAVSGLSFSLSNLSESQDTELLQKALSQLGSSGKLDVNHAGTSFRFLTALLAISKGTFELTGSSRLKQRPVGELVEVLKKLGADIEFLEKDGFPPLKIKGGRLTGGNLSIRGDISSQFITALLLIAPTFENGLTLSLTTPLVSRPYVDMTIKLMREFGITVSFEDDLIIVQSGNYSYDKDTFKIEGDWSSAGYWYEIAALSSSAEITLENLFKDSSQADKAVSDIYKEFGVETSWLEDKVVLSKSQGKTITKKLTYDFTECPDAAQTVSATCAGLGIEAFFSGLQTLKIKETDRILALQNELTKFGLTVETSDSTIHQKGILVDSGQMVSTYHDHRMALSFAPLSLKLDSVRIEDENVIGKSYPTFWKDLQKAGFTVISVEN